jgi:putative hydrolase of the HAD superfamily
MTVQAVIFDWGGTLTPWHTVDHDALWLEVCAPHFPGELAASHAKAIRAAEFELWRLSETAQQSATLGHVFARAGVTAHDGLLAACYRAWEPHTYTDPDVAPLLRGLRTRGIRIGVLSNTMWPRSAHESVFSRDGVLSLIDGAVCTAARSRGRSRTRRPSAPRWRLSACPTRRRASSSATALMTTSTAPSAPACAAC